MHKTDYTSFFYVCDAADGWVVFDRILQYQDIAMVDTQSNAYNWHESHKKMVDVIVVYFMMSSDWGDAHLRHYILNVPSGFASGIIYALDFVIFR